MGCVYVLCGECLRNPPDAVVLVQDNQDDRVFPSQQVIRPKCTEQDVTPLPISMRALMKELEQLQQECGEQVLILAMNVDENFQIPAELEVLSLPTLALYCNGEFVRFIGGVGKREELAKQIQTALNR